MDGGRLADFSDVELRAGHWTDILAIARMIVEGSQGGHFDPKMLSPRVLLGASLQLLLVMAVGRLMGPGGQCQPAWVYVLRSKRRCLGFALLTGLPAQPPREPRTQISLFKVASSAQSHGLGTRMLSLLMAAMPQGSTVEAECLPSSKAMQRLLTRQGFRRLAGARPGVQHWLRKAA